MCYRAYLIFFLFSIAHGWAQDPKVLYLTWRDDPATTMMVLWHTDGSEAPSTIYYKALGEDSWQQDKATAQRLDHSSLHVHQVELTGLKADTNYLFQLEGGEEHRFRTLPATLDRPLKVAIGGDAYYTPEINEKMNLEVASRDPDFVIMAGDIAYTEGLKSAFRTPGWKIERWEEFFQFWTKNMVTKDGRLIPIVPVLGNHDIREGFDNPFKQQVFFYQFFPLPNMGIPFQLMKVGSSVCFYLLDSGHSFPIGGAQTEWLQKSLEENSEVAFKIPVYHIAAYPTETSYTHRGSKDIRKFWTPLFEKYGVKVCMEHDNHTFKRTFPIKEGKIDSSGIYYVGDGAWGVPPLKPHRHWYLAKALQSNCCWLLTITPSLCQFQAFNLNGEILDDFQISSKQSD